MNGEKETTRQPVADSKSQISDLRGRTWALFVLLFLTYAYFYQGGSWGTNIRFDLVRALVEEGTLKVDTFHANTGDKAVFGGHYYSDKAPGLSFLAAPSHFLAFGLARVLGWDLNGHSYVTFASYVAVLATTSLPSALLGVALYWLLRHLLEDVQAALLAAIGFSLGTIAFPYATLFHGHPLCAALLFLAFALLWRAKQSHVAARPRSLLLAGLLAGYGVITEFPAAPVGVMLFGYALWTRPRKVDALWFILGAAPPVALLLTHNWLCFGGPLEFGYQRVHGAGFAEGMKAGMVGVTYPKMFALRHLTFSAYRGLFFFCPFLVLAFPGVVCWARRGEGLPELALASAVSVYFFLFNASYYLWAGGFAFGPRHVIPALPFLAMLAAFAVARAKAFSAVLIAASVFFMLVGVAVGPEFPNSIFNPLFDYLLPSFWDGRLSVSQQSFNDIDPNRSVYQWKAEFNAFNLGELMGLRGLSSLLPLLAMWAGCGVWLWRPQGA